MKKEVAKKKQKKVNKKPIPKKQSVPMPSSVFKEMTGILLSGISILVLIGIFSSNSGLFGHVIRSIFIGLLGIGGYVLPVLVMICGIFYMQNRKKQMKSLIIYGSYLILLMSCFFHILYFGEEMTIPLLGFDYITYASWQNGGYIGAALGYLLIKLLGIYGTYVVLAVLYGVWILLVTRFPVFTWLHDKLRTGLREIYMSYKVQLARGKTEASKKRRDRPNNIPKKRQEQEEYLLTALELATEENEPEERGIEEPEDLVHIPYFDGRAYDEEPALEGVPKETTRVSPTEEQTHVPKMTHAEVIKNEPHIEASDLEEVPEYHFPSVGLLKKVVSIQNKEASKKSLNDARKLTETLASFGVEAKVTQIHRGPSVTRYELQPKQGVKVSKIVNLADDIALNLAAPNIRIEAPIPGKAAVGIEVANQDSEFVYLRDVIDSDRFTAFPSKLAFALGKDIAGKPIIADIGKMPHLLIAGATGSGKSVCINTLIASIIYKASPKEVRLIMIDPKVVELSVYNGIPHLLIPVVTDPKKAAGALFWAVNEMTRRYNLFAENNVRDMKGYNDKVEEEKSRLPQIVIIIDELADLMMTGAKEVEDAICRLAQMARAAGIHLVIATQRPSVDVITGVIKANIPSRLAFAVSSGTDSRTILDMTGAEKLLGKGDMLFYPVGEAKPIRIQGAFISDQEVESIVNTIKMQEASYEQSVIETVENSKIGKSSENDEDEADELLEKAIEFAAGKEKLSISMLQRYFRIGFNRAARLMDALETRDIVGPDEGSKPRKVL